MNFNKTPLPDFEKFKKEIENLQFKEQLERLTRVRTHYEQTCNRNLENVLELPFDEKCRLEINMIKELIELNNS